MIVKNTSTTPSIIAADATTIFEVLHPKKDDSIDISYSLAIAELKGHQSSKPHRLRCSTEVYVILNGTGIVHIDNETQEVTTEDVVYIPENTVQYIENTTSQRLRFLCIVSPPYHKRDDVSEDDKDNL